ncbi:exopolysaccharide Pel transporter PelG [Halobacillus litoralis]|uniref:exopolysaccharide Pel transporter PelG n=1 Tax=Halobacillus litoralis TaxID=45668 RepID=UPI001CFC68FE|nr:exopolysaccharide Pel transporter PelG [Halobacillus litoralis]
MAGIGFHLKKLLEEDYLSSKIQAYSFACLVTSGPWLIVTTTIFLIHWLAGYMQSYTPGQIELFTFAVSYCFIFSQISFGTHQFVVTRYVADLIYKEEREDIFPAFLGVSKTITIISFMMWFVFCIISPLSLLFKGTLFILFGSINLIWVLSLFLTAAKNYKIISTAYLAGGVSAFVFNYISSTPIFENFYNPNSYALILLIGFTLGMVITLFILFHTLIQTFPTTSITHQFNYLSYFGHHPSMFIVGLFYNLGIWISSFIIWFGAGSRVIEQSFLIHPEYDTALFWSFLTIIPAIVLFVVSLETKFYKQYLSFYDYINKGGTLTEINNQKKKMFQTLSKDIENLIKSQAIFTILILIMSGYLFNLMGINQRILSIFRFTTLGAFSTVMFMIFLLMLLYFENRKGAMYCTLFFFAVNGSTTLLLLPYNYKAYGISFAIGSAISFIYTAVTLIRYLQNIEFHAFLGQGTMPFKERKRLQKAIRWLNKIQISTK